MGMRQGENERLSYREYCTGSNYLLEEREDVFQIGAWYLPVRKILHDILSYAIRVAEEGEDRRKGSSLNIPGIQDIMKKTFEVYGKARNYFICESVL